MRLPLAFILLITAACATSTRPLTGHPGWTLEESATPLVGAPDDVPPACGFQRPGAEPGPPRAPCGMTDATTSCAEKRVRLWWYARPGALEHELTHVAACRP